MYLFISLFFELYHKFKYLYSTSFQVINDFIKTAHLTCARSRIFTQLEIYFVVSASASLFKLKGKKKPAAILTVLQKTHFSRKKKEGLPVVVSLFSGDCECPPLSWRLMIRKPSFVRARRKDGGGRAGLRLELFTPLTCVWCACWAVRYLQAARVEVIRMFVVHSSCFLWSCSRCSKVPRDS